MSTFVTVFDASRFYWAKWAFAFYGIPFIGIGIYLKNLPDTAFKGKIQTWIFRRLWLRFAVFWTVFALILQAGQWALIQYSFTTKHYDVVEASVQNFRPMPYEGHSEESFNVQGVPFSYSDYANSMSFNTTASHGGPIYDNAHVRITYVGNLIIKLEIKQ